MKTLLRLCILLGFLVGMPRLAHSQTQVTAQPAVEHVICDSGCGSPPATPDTATFTAGVTNVSIVAAAFDDTLTALAAGKSGAPRMTAYRGIHFNLRDNSGNEVLFPAVLGTGGGFKVSCVDGCGGASSFADNSAFTFGTTSINITGYVFDDVAPNAAIENRAAAPRMSGNRVPYSILRDAAGNERGANVNSRNQLTISADSMETLFDTGGQLTSTTCPGSGCLAFSVSAYSGVTIQLTGTADADGVFEETLNGTDWVLLTAVDDQFNVITPTWDFGSGQGLYVRAYTGGAYQFRVRAATFTSGTVNVAIGRTAIYSEPGVYVKGLVGVNCGNCATATNQTNGGQKTQVVDSGGNSITATGNALDVNVRSWLGSSAPTVGQKTMANSVPVVIASNQTTFPINATLSAETTKVIGAVNQGTNPWIVNLISGFSLAATQTDRTQKTQITDGTRDGTVKAASTAAAAGDTSFVVAFSPNSALPTGANTIGALTANQSVNVAQVAGGATSTVATGVQKVAIADSTGAAFLSAANALNSTGSGVQATQLVGQFDDVSPTAITENQFGNVRFSANRNLYFTLRDAAGSERGQNVTSNNNGQVELFTGATAYDARSIRALTSSDVVTVTDGAGALNVIVDSGTAVVTQATAANLNAQVVGAAASGASKAGNPVQIGGVFNTTQPTVTSGQAVEAQATARGALIVAPGVDNFAVQATLAAETTKVIGTVNQGTSPWVVAGGKTNNNAAPGATNLGVLPMLATAADQSWTEGNLVAGSVDLSGFLRTKVSSWLGSTAPTVGSKTSANSIPVVVASDQGAVPISGTVTANPTTTNHLSIAVAESVAAPTALTWYLKRQWALPASAHFIPSRAFSAVTTAGSRTLIGVINNLGNLNVSTNTFTDGNSVASPRHYARLIGCVTTVMSATANTVTVTYVDELGNSQTTAAVSIPASTPVGNCFDFPLNATTGQMLDVGVRDITAMADTAAPTGVLTIYGMNPILDALGVGNAYEQSDYDQGELSSAEQIAILFQQGVVTAQQRNAGVLGSIR